MISRFFCSAATVLALFFTSSNAAHAHKPSDSYLSLKVEQNQLQGQWDIALRDLDFAIGIDSDDNGAITWDEVRGKHKDIAAYAMSRLAFSNGNERCPVELGEQMLDEHSDGTYTVIYFKVLCKEMSTIQLSYKLLFDIDPQHKGLLKLTNAAGEVSTTIFSPDHADQILTLAEASNWQQFLAYVKHGVWHIWIGFDHILFLLSLLLPAVLLIKENKWAPALSFKSAGLDVLKIVTAFTLAHSITLSLATLEVLSLPSRWVESAIALSVILAALNNLFPLFRGQRWMLAFVFGLIHGFGFASVLSDLGLPQASLSLALIGFNLGVEVGQMAIVAVFLPFAFALRAKRIYQKVIYSGGSCAIILLATIWLFERVFEMRIIPA
ncbi:MAG: HupE/UreJ family protein [Pseudomonadota bacterium]